MVYLRRLFNEFHAISSLLLYVVQRWARKFLLLVRKFLGSFRNSKSVYFWGVPIRKSQIRTFVREFAEVLSLPKINKSAHRKSANCHICGRYSIQTKFNIRKFANFRFAELICPPLMSSCQQNFRIPNHTLLIPSLPGGVVLFTWIYFHDLARK
jgi:hypothetical protein